MKFKYTNIDLKLKPFECLVNPLLCYFPKYGIMHTLYIELIETQRDFYQDGLTILLSDLMNNMDHMRISGIEPLSAILCQTAYCKKKNWNKTSQNANTCWSQKRWCNKPHFNHFSTQKMSILSKRYESTEVYHGYMFPRSPLVHQQWHSPSSWNVKWDFY